LVFRKRQRGTARAGHRRGFTLTEITIAVAVFGIAAGTTVYSLLQAKYLSWTNRERGIALEAAQSTMEELRGEDFHDVFALYNADPLDDPGPGPGPGPNFAVAGLNVRTGDPDGFVGEIQFPGDGIQLREDFADREFGTQRDLDLDGQIDAADHGDDYEVLPVRIRVRWRGPRGDEQVELITTLVERWPGA